VVTERANKTERTNAVERAGVAERTDNEERAVKVERIDLDERNFQPLEICSRSCGEHQILRASPSWQRAPIRRASRLANGKFFGARITTRLAIPDW
jgi:hypothetical protein